MVWLTGLSGAGKTTMAEALERALFARGIAVFVLEGPWRLLGFAPAAVVLMTALVPAAGAPRPAASAPSSDFLRIKVAHANLWARNREHANFVAWVRSEHPDILVVSELTAEWASALQGLADILPFRRLAGSGDVGILSVWPWRDAEVGPLARPLAVVDLDTPAGALSVAISKNPFVIRTFDGSTSGDTITITSHGFQNGDRVIYDRRGTGAAVGGLVDGRIYIVSVIDANQIQLKPSNNGAPITLTGVAVPAGTTHRLINAEDQIQLVFTAANWFTPQPVFVMALDDTAAEGQHYTAISNTVLSRDVIAGTVSPAAG